MRAAPLLARSSWLVGAVSAVGLSLIGCGSERVRLGDGPLDTHSSTHPSGVSEAGAPTASVTVGPAPISSPSGPSPSASSPAPVTTATSEPPEPVDSGVPPAATMDGGSSEPGVDVGSDAAPTCPNGQVSAAEVYWVGDSWLFQPSGEQVARVEEHARSAGVLASDESYQSAATDGAYLDDVIGQYRARRSSSPSVKLLIMDGGTFDTILRGTSDEVVSSVVQLFGDFLDEVAADGVEHVIYVLMPELDAIGGVRELRPGLSAACAQSAVPCHFLDLQPVWAGHELDYTNQQTLVHPSAAGASAIGDSIWAIMQDQCI